MTWRAHTRVSGKANRRASLHTGDRVRRTHQAHWRWAGLIVLAVMIAALQGGCASSSEARIVEYDYTSTAPTQRGDAEAAASSGGVETPSLLAQQLADQSARDVELMLAARNQGPQTEFNGIAQGESGVAAEETPARRAAAPTPRPAIIWNDAPAAVATSSSLTNLPTAAETTEPVVADDASGLQRLTHEPAIDPAMLRPDRIRQLMVDLSRELYAEGAYSAHPLRELAVIAALGMRDPQRRLDPAAIPDLTDDERELLAALQTFFVNVGQALDAGDGAGGSSNAAAPTVAKHAAELRAALVREPTLRLSAAALCTRVGGFGDYTPFEKNTFLAASEQKAIVYLEIQEFVSEINQNNEYVTELSQQLTIYSERDGIPVWKEDWLTATDVTRNKRQDFFTTQIITLPRALSVGRYTLKIRVRDEKSRAETETSIGFEMVADPRMTR